MISYKPDIHDVGQYSFSYSAMREDYLRFTMMSDEEFLSRLPEILHFACFACYIKEVPSYICLSDTGVIYELIHLLNGNDITATPLDRIRDSFNRWCCFA